MASLTNPNPIDNTSPNGGADLDANFDICKSNDDALNAELATKANASTVDQRTTIQTGTGHAPTGTPVKMSWLEGTTDGSGILVLNHSFGSNILQVLASAAAGVSYAHYQYGELLGATLNGSLSYNTTFIQYYNQLTPNANVRILVFHK